MRLWIIKASQLGVNSEYFNNAARVIIYLLDVFSKVRFEDIKFRIMRWETQDIYIVLFIMWLIPIFENQRNIVVDFNEQ